MSGRGGRGGRGGFGDRGRGGRGGRGGFGGRGGRGGRGEDDAEERPRLIPKKEKTKDKLDLLVQSIQIGENKKWVASASDTAFTKLMVKALFTKNPKEIQVSIEEKKKGTENKLRTKIKYGDLKWMQFDEAKNTIMILTHLPTPFEIGERGENTRGERTTNWKDAIAVDFQDEKVNPKPNMLTIELTAKSSITECKERFAKSDPKITKWLNTPVEAKKDEDPATTVDTPKEEKKADKTEDAPAKKEKPAKEGNTKKNDTGAEKKKASETKPEEKKEQPAQENTNDKKRKRSGSNKEEAPAKLAEAKKTPEKQDQTEKPKKKKQKTDK